MINIYWPAISSIWKVESRQVNLSCSVTVTVMIQRVCMSLSLNLTYFVPFNRKVVFVSIFQNTGLSFHPCVTATKYRIKLVIFKYLVLVLIGRRSLRTGFVVIELWLVELLAFKLVNNCTLYWYEEKLEVLMNSNYFTTRISWIRTIFKEAENTLQKFLIH